MIVHPFKASTGAPLVLTLLEVPAALRSCLYGDTCRLWLLEDITGCSIGSGRLTQGLVVKPVLCVAWIETEASIDPLWRGLGIYSATILPNLAHWCGGELFSDIQRTGACTGAWEKTGAELVEEPITGRDRFRLTASEGPVPYLE